MDDEGRAIWAIVLWSIAFHGGMYVAAGMNKTVGLMMMACATAILISVLRADRRIEAEKRRRRKYQEDAERRAEEAMKK